MPKINPTAAPAPHSWSIDAWPQSVYPHGPSKGRYVVKAHRDALLAAGALTRVGRDLVVLGEPFTRWLQSQSNRVEGFHIAPNASSVPQAGATGGRREPEAAGNSPAA
jgi:hypothetical protein